MFLRIAHKDVHVNEKMKIHVNEQESDLKENICFPKFPEVFILSYLRWNILLVQL